MEKHVTFKNTRKQELSGVLHLPDREGSYPLAIFAHGMKSSKDSRKATELAQYLLIHKIGMLRFDFTGCGQSDGSFHDITVTRLNQDLKAAFWFATGLESVDSSRIAVIGSSLGGMTTLLALSEGLPSKTAVLISPVTDWKDNHCKVRAENAMPNEFYIDIWKRDFYELARQIRQPCLVIHGDEDQVCFLRGSRKLIENLNTESRLEIVKGADHRYTDSQHFRQMVSLTVDWIRERL